MALAMLHPRHWGSPSRTHDGDPALSPAPREGKSSRGGLSQVDSGLGGRMQAQHLIVCQLSDVFLIRH